MITRVKKFMGATMRNFKLGVGFCLLFACLHVAAPAVELDRDRGFKVDEFGMLMQEAVRPEILKAITAGKTNQIMEVSSWDGRPVAVGASVSNGYLRARLESDFLVLWLKMERRPPIQSSTLVDIVGHAAGSLLNSEFAIGGSGANLELVVLDGPRGNPEDFFAVCSYTGLGGENGWPYTASAHILVKDADIIVVLRILTASTSDISEHEGIEANKTQRSASVIPGIEKMSDIPEHLLNGCMWPTEGSAPIPIAPASRLAPILWPTEGDASIPIAPASGLAPIGKP